MSISRPKGTMDLLPPLARPGPLQSQAAFSRILHSAGQVLNRAGAQAIATPILESRQLAEHGVGQSSDIVLKEMFEVRYQGGHGDLILRPEGTASVVRAYLENGLKQLPAPLKLWTSGPMFRAENVQKGRLRQFHQIDYEVLGSDQPLADAEAIDLMWSVVQVLGLGQAHLKVGSVGDPADRERYRAYLRELLSPAQERLSPDSRRRLEVNPLRILDSKAPADQELLSELAPQNLLDFLGEEAREHLDAVTGYLDSWGVPYQLDPSIVRGLDYYQRTAWELHHGGIGAKSALGGGGRYDGLSELLGGKALSGVGWALGVERLLLALQEEQSLQEPELGSALYLGALTEAEQPAVLALARELRALGTTEFAYRPRPAATHQREALRRGARWLGLIGPEERGSGRVSLKDLASGERWETGAAQLAAQLGWAAGRDTSR